MVDITKKSAENIIENNNYVQSGFNNDVIQNIEAMNFKVITYTDGLSCYIAGFENIHNVIKEYYDNFIILEDSTVDENGNFNDCYNIHNYLSSMEPVTKIDEITGDESLDYDYDYTQNFSNEFVYYYYECSFDGEGKTLLKLRQKTLTNQNQIIKDNLEIPLITIKSLYVNPNTVWGSVDSYVEITILYDESSRLFADRIEDYTEPTTGETSNLNLGFATYAGFHHEKTVLEANKVKAIANALLNNPYYNGTEHYLENYYVHYNSNKNNTAETIQTNFINISFDRNIDFQYYIKMESPFKVLNNLTEYDNTFSNALNPPADYSNYNGNVPYQFIKGVTFMPNNDVSYPSEKSNLAGRLHHAINAFDKNGNYIYTTDTDGMGGSVTITYDSLDSPCYLSDVYSNIDMNQENSDNGLVYNYYVINEENIISISTGHSTLCKNYLPYEIGSIYPVTGHYSIFDDTQNPPGVYNGECSSINANEGPGYYNRCVPVLKSAQEDIYLPQNEFSIGYNRASNVKISKTYTNGDYNNPTIKYNAATGPNEFYIVGYQNKMKVTITNGEKLTIEKILAAVEYDIYDYGISGNMATAKTLFEESDDTYTYQGNKAQIAAYKLDNVANLKYFEFYHYTNDHMYPNTYENGTLIFNFSKYVKDVYNIDYDLHYGIMINFNVVVTNGTQIINEFPNLIESAYYNVDKKITHIPYGTAAFSMRNDVNSNNISNVVNSALTDFYNKYDDYELYTNYDTNYELSHDFKIRANISDKRGANALSKSADCLSVYYEVYFKSIHKTTGNIFHTTLNIDGVISYPLYDGNDMFYNISLPDDYAIDCIFTVGKNGIKIPGYENPNIQ